VTETIAQPKIVVVCGPTGVGKTGFAIDLARHFGARILGADSMQIYRRMDIGTAKPTPQERAAVTHHLVDFIEPDHPFDAAAYAQRAHRVVQELIAEGILPLVVGGTGLYIKALIYGLFNSRSADPALRRRLQERAQREGPAALHAFLAHRDPRAAERIHPNDTYRIVRALEVATLTGRSISTHHQHHGFARPRYNALKIGLSLPRERLYERIDHRVDMMLDQGLKEEVRRLLDAGFGAGLKSMQALGYRHMIAYLQGDCTWEETVRLLKRDHRRYAKRQLTWFGADAEVHWLEPDQQQAACQLVSAFLNTADRRGG
jgi:tRNA dimethylallyltransferase